MGNTIRNIGLIALAAAILYKPAKRLLMAQRAERDGDDFYGEDEGVLRKTTFANSYRGQHKPHHRHAKANGHVHGE